MTLTQEPVALAAGATYMGLLAGLPPEAVLGAFTGSAIFLLGVKNQPAWKWMIYFTVAFMAGLLGASTVSAIVGGAIGLIGIKVTVPLGMGAMASASCMLNVISWLRDNAARIAAKRLGVTPKGDAE